MVQVEDGDTVMVHYTGKLEDGTVFDTTANSDPMQFRIGDNEIIPRVEQAMIEMEPGESKIVEVPADEAYGPHHRELVLAVDRNVFSEDAQPEVGLQFEVRRPDSQPIVAMVTDVTESNATLDANHPLAGKDLIFDVQLLETV
ncbi:MAG: peptidylprolyl isomerase [Euryarchaeota archaeon]|nr:peptidylprolyl isomerase [Euryarchaeota archaeon]